MVLLQWAVVEPVHGMAAIRFVRPVRIESVRVFPTGARPFQQCEDVIAYVHARITLSIHLILYW